jgi:hypothetical protein
MFLAMIDSCIAAARMIWPQVQQAECGILTLAQEELAASQGGLVNAPTLARNVGPAPSRRWA